jgi:hypothetical protein
LHGSDSLPSSRLSEPCNDLIGRAGAQGVLREERIGHGGLMDWENIAGVAPAPLASSKDCDRGGHDLSRPAGCT